MIVDVRNPHDPDVFLDLKLKPNASLRPEALPRIMALVVGVSGVLSIAFFQLGAWPVVGFLGLDILGVYIALKYYMRHTHSYERIRIDREACTIIRYDAHVRRHNHKEICDPAFLSTRHIADDNGAFMLRHRDGESLLGKYLAAHETKWVLGALKGASQSRQRALVNIAS